MKSFLWICLLVAGTLRAQNLPVVAVYNFTSNVHNNPQAGQQAAAGLRQTQTYVRPVYRPGMLMRGGYRGFQFHAAMQPAGYKVVQTHPVASAASQARAANGARVQLSNSVQSSVEAAFVNAHRFTVVERSRIGALVQEMKTQEAMSETQVAQLGKTLGANYVVLGHVESAGSTREGGGRGFPANFDASVTFQIEVIDVASSQIKAADQLTAEGSGNSREEATAAALGQLSTRVEKFIADNFPATYVFLKATEVHGNKVHKVEVGAAAGSPALAKGTRLSLEEISVTETEGQSFERMTTVAELKVEKAEGQVYVCEVVKNGDVLKTKADTKARLVAVQVKE
jgi:hypothetical protein